VRQLLSILHEGSGVVLVSLLARGSDGGRHAVALCRDR
jgi:hypothetical protein